MKDLEIIHPTEKNKIVIKVRNEDGKVKLKLQVRESGMVSY